MAAIRPIPTAANLSLCLLRLQHELAFPWGGPRLPHGEHPKRDVCAASRGKERVKKRDTGDERGRLPRRGPHRMTGVTPTQLTDSSAPQAPSTKHKTPATPRTQKAEGAPGETVNREPTKCTECFASCQRAADRGTFGDNTSYVFCDGSLCAGNSLWCSRDGREVSRRNR